MALLPEFSRAPSAIHWRSRLTASSGSCGDDGGMNGSRLWPITWKMALLSGSPGLTRAPELPPSMTLVKLLRTTPPRFLSGLWQATHLSFNSGRTLSS